MSRGGNRISRDDSYSVFDSATPSWADDYVKAVEKYSTKSRREDETLFGQINDILGRSKSKYSSVEDAVRDMQIRSGFLDMMKKQANEGSPESFGKIPEMKTFIDNYIESYPGTSVGDVVFNLLKVPFIKSQLTDGEDVGADVKEYINTRIAEGLDRAERTGPDNSHIGTADVNVDAETQKANSPLNILTPNR